MIVCRSLAEIDRLRRANALVAEVLQRLTAMVVPGITTAEIDAEAERLVRAAGAEPAFKGYHGYPATICAERAAVTKAISEGRSEFSAVAVVTSNGGTPCGICRQVLSEFSPEMVVIIADAQRITAEYTLDELLPHSFGPHHLK